VISESFLPLLNIYHAERGRIEEQEKHFYAETCVGLSEGLTTAGEWIYGFICIFAFWKYFKHVRGSAILCRCWRKEVNQITKFMHLALIKEKRRGAKKDEMRRSF